MKIKLLDNSIYPVTRVEVINGRLELDFKTKTAEELQEIFSKHSRLKKIVLMDDENNPNGDQKDWTVYAGIHYFGDTKTVILTKEVDDMQKRLTDAEANALEAATLAQSAKATTEDIAQQVTDLQMAMCELYEGAEV